jgi:choline dehydrogenase-like flavoprotein
MEYDVVIIGSGSGGGVVAAELSGLCAGGARVAVLEWGPRLLREEYTGNEIEMVSRLYFNSGGFFTKNGRMTVAFCKAYGGSTTVYTGTSFIMAPETLRSWAVPDLDWGDLNRRSLKYFAANNIHTQDDESIINDNNRLFRNGCQKLGLEVTPFPINVKGCRGSGLCNLGCPHGAKQGAGEVQLPLAEKNGVEVITNCKAERLGDREVFATVGAWPGYGARSPWEPGEYRIRAKRIVVCGGTVNTCALMLRSGYGRIFPSLGRSVTLHPALIMVGIHESPVDGFYGHPKTYCCDRFPDSDGYILETCFYFPFTTAKSCAGFGPDHEELMKSYRNHQQIIALAFDEPEPSNRVTADKKGEPILDYTLSGKTLDSLHQAMLWAARIFFAAGAQKVHAPAARRLLIDRADEGRLEELVPRSGVLPGRISITSAHVMGGCAMGADQRTSVTDSCGRVHGVPWLYVADGSLFPRCARVNPYVTIMALAARVAEGVKKDMGAGA